MLFATFFLILVGLSEFKKEKIVFKTTLLGVGSAIFLYGVFWSWSYWRFNSLYLNIISHTIWDATIFVIFPIT